MNPDGAIAHREALDLAVLESTGPYLLSFHTDTIPLREGWLGWLVGELTREERTAAVGTYKLENKPLKRLEAWAIRRLSPRSSAAERRREYIRSHCALYRRAVLETLHLTFGNADGQTTGRNVHFGLEEAGYTARLLPVGEMLRWVVHLNHGTVAMVRDRGGSRKTVVHGTRRIERFLSRPEVRAVYEDESLDG